MDMGAFPAHCELGPRERVLVVARVLHGSLYVWGGNLISDGGLDCSGFVQTCFMEAGIGAWATKFPTKLDLTAQGLHDALAPIGPDEHPLPGDVACYGSSATGINHVMLVEYMEPGGERVQVVGASKGDRSCTSPDVALEKGARVKTFPSHRYRGDFVAFRRMPLS